MRISEYGKITIKKNATTTATTKNKAKIPQNHRGYINEEREPLKRTFPTNFFFHSDRKQMVEYIKYTITGYLALFHL